MPLRFHASIDTMFVHAVAPRSRQMTNSRSWTQEEGIRSQYEVHYPRVKRLFVTQRSVEIHAFHHFSHRGSQRAAVRWRLHKLVMAVNRAYLMSESTADSKCSNNSPEIPLRLKRSRSNEKETSITVLPSVLGPSFPWNSERLFDRFGSAI